jgi:hypothetical protein
MKYPWLALAAFLAACGTSTDLEIDDRNEAVLSAPQEVTLQFGAEVAVGGSVLMVSFARVAEDSRCPVDVTCVWAGNATVEVGIRMGMGPTFPLLLNTTLAPRWVDWNDVRVTLLELLPEPRAGDPPRPEGYTVKLRLENVS